MRRTIVAAFLMTASLSMTRPASAGQMTYLSLGDSVAFGETDYSKDPSNGNRGYVNLDDKYLGAQNGGVNPKVINLAVDGETSTSFMTASGRVAPGPGITDAMLAANNPRYQANTALSRNTKLIQAIGSEMAKENTIGNVTVSLGANDLFALAISPGFLADAPGPRPRAVGLNGDQPCSRASPVVQLGTTGGTGILVRWPSISSALR